ncbi:c-type cytochrome [Kiloniella antarctica]|uniref:C-type cytochrome n=1 Tax=Kiloniella antarctica TaxID=1550907 RepID=A0ABW5BPY9_9PROT
MKYKIFEEFKNMKVKNKYQIIFVLGFVVLVGGVFANNIIENMSDSEGIKVPEFSVIAQKGKIAFNNSCAQCHGSNGSGTSNGPPLIHNIYNPGHHGDQSFILASKNGVRQHHWKFGNMPPQRQVQLVDVQNIIRYIREIQEENGILYQKHTM